jgi:hypothetical protein
MKENIEMGIVLIGEGPTSRDGEYFRASGPLLVLIRETCFDILGEQILKDMYFDCGAGPDSQSVCDAMADRINQWMEYNVDGKTIEATTSRVSKDLWFPSPEELAAIVPSESARKIEDERIKEFVRFLRHCGGFAVWRDRKHE